MIYISCKEKNLISQDCAVVFEGLSNLGIDGDEIEIISDDVAVDKKFEKRDFVIFVSRGSLVSAMLVKYNCMETAVILVSSSLNGRESGILGCGEIIFLEKDDKCIEKIFSILKNQ